jgi:molybdopterin-binding protein
VLAAEVGVAVGVVGWGAVNAAVAIDLGVSFVTASVVTTFWTFVELAACHGYWWSK